MKKLPQSIPLFVEDLTDRHLDILWAEAQPHMGIADDESIEQALSGDDPAAARAYLFWLHKCLRDRQPISDEVRSFAVSALGRLTGKKTLGQAFGLERTKRGNPPNRSGAVSAVVGLIGYLHDECGYSLSDSADRSSAFEVASILLQRRWKFTRAPNTLRDQFWNKRSNREKR